MKHNLDGLGIRELDDLISAAKARLAVMANRRPIERVRAEVTAIAITNGYFVEELFNVVEPANPMPKKRMAKRRRAKVAAKYRDPDNRRNTWTGRGSMPRWLAEKVKRGQSATDYLIPGLAQPQPKKGGAIGRKTVYKAA